MPPDRPYRPEALPDVIRQLEAKKERLEAHLGIKRTRRKKRSWLRRLFGWGSRDQ